MCVSCSLSPSPGTGASCIYPLLGASMNGWYFLATEVDDICFDYATKNVEQNNLSDLIKGKPAFRSPPRGVFPEVRGWWGVQHWGQQGLARRRTLVFFVAVRQTAQ